MDKKKFRQKYNLYLVEGNKIISELSASSHQPVEIFTTTPEFFGNEENVTAISSAELRKISFLQHPKDSVAICEPKINKKISAPVNLVLDGIQDPGNLGTLLRLADWFGIEQVVCSEDTADFYNPKVLQASMGSFLRVNIIYENLEEFLKNTSNSNIGTFMNGESIYDFRFPQSYNLVLGNEGNGIREATERCLGCKVSIPRFGKNKSAESLNVAMAAGIILSAAFRGK